MKKLAYKAKFTLKGDPGRIRRNMSYGGGIPKDLADQSLQELEKDVIENLLTRLEARMSSNFDPILSKQIDFLRDALEKQNG